MGRGARARWPRSALAIGLVADFDSGAPGLQHAVDETWIPDLGVRYQLGIDGINLFLVLLTAVALVRRDRLVGDPRRRSAPKTYFFMLGLAQTATLGAFLAQDLLLFVLFFDLMLIPFYFLFGSWGRSTPAASARDDQPGPATIKMIVYTLVGSLLMLVGAIATGVIAGDGGTPVFSMAELAANPLGDGSQRWIFWFFAAAFLVKMPAFLVHGWMPDAYRVGAAAGAGACSPACSPRSAPTASCGWCCRSSPTPRSSSRRWCW